LFLIVVALFALDLDNSAIWVIVKVVATNSEADHPALEQGGCTMRRIMLVLALAAVLVATLIVTAGPAMADNDRQRCHERESNDTIVCNERGDRDDREVFVEADEFFDEFDFPIFVVVLDDNCDGIDDDGDLEIDEDGFCDIGFDGGFDLDLDLDDLGPDF
jgi:hypothetical protein